MYTIVRAENGSWMWYDALSVFLMCCFESLWIHSEPLYWRISNFDDPCLKHPESTAKFWEKWSAWSETDFLMDHDGKLADLYIWISNLFKRLGSKKKAMRQETPRLSRIQGSCVWAVVRGVSRVKLGKAIIGRGYWKGSVNIQERWFTCIRSTQTHQNTEQASKVNVN